MPRRFLALAVVIVIALSLAFPAAARPLTWARAGDALSLDPHAFNEGPTHTLNHHLYEPLVVRDAKGKTRPALAEAWRRTEEPLIWEFRIRQGVRFHDGSPLTVDDVAFSLERARSETSDMRALLSTVDRIVPVDAHTLRITTRARDPLLPIRLTDIMILSRRWAEANNLIEPRPAARRAEGRTVAVANGTGAFRLVSREADVRTVLERNEAYWGWTREKTEITRLTYLPIASHEKRVEALLSGAVDFVQDLPVSALAKVSATPSLRLNVGPENRVIFFGVNLAATELASSDVRGRNPFADVRVRQALSIAIDRKAIQQSVMRGQSIPTGIIAPPGINGYPAALDKIPPTDLDRARKLIADAGFGSGFTVTLNCPNDRYVNDEAICRAVAQQLAKVGIRANVLAQTKGQHFTQVRAGKSDFYLLGWGVPTFDSAYVFQALYHTRSATDGDWNGTGYSDPEVDRLIDGLNTENDLDERSRIMARIWESVQAAQVYAPLHIQTLAYAMKDWADIPVDISNTPKLWQAKIKPAPAAPAPAATPTDTRAAPGAQGAAVPSDGATSAGASAPANATPTPGSAPAPKP